MTVIAWDGRTLAADRQITTCGLRAEVRKLFVGPGWVAVAAGDVSHALGMIEWLRTGAFPEKWPDFQRTEDWARLIVADAKGCRYYEREPYPVAVYGKRAWGAGAEAASGAMEAGATAEEAVLIANRLVEGCGFGVDSFTVIEAPAPEERVSAFDRKPDLVLL